MPEVITTFGDNDTTWSEKLEAMTKAAIMLDTYVHTLSNTKLDTHVHDLLDTMTSVLDTLSEMLDQREEARKVSEEKIGQLDFLGHQLEVDLRARDSTIMTLTAELEAAKQQVTILGLLLTMNGGGTDPHGYYAGTPGQWAKAVLEVARTAQRWHDHASVDPMDLAMLRSAVELLNMAEAEKGSSNG